MFNPASIDLTISEALVLFDWLARSSEAGAPITKINDAERRVLWNLESILESLLVAPFSEDYAKLLADARRAVLER